VREEADLAVPPTRVAVGHSERDSERVPERVGRELAPVRARVRAMDLSVCAHVCLSKQMRVPALKCACPAVMPPRVRSSFVLFLFLFCVRVVCGSSVSGCGI